MTAAGHLNLFSAHDGRHGYELWRTDGTAAGTHMVADLVRGPRGSDPKEFVALGDHAYFFADDALWRTDGTAGGTSRLQLDPDARYFANPRGLTVFKNALYFSDTDARGAGRLWRSDGTAGGYTRLVQQSGQAPESKAGPVGSLHAVGDVLIFAQKDTAGEQWLWRTDGTPGGTFGLHGGLYVFDHRFVGFGEELYFFGNSERGHRGTALWRTDGTRVGTEIVKRFSMSERLLVAVGSASAGTLYLRGHDPEHGAELWKSDGTEAGTVLVKDLWTGRGSDAPSIFVPEYEPPPLPGAGSWLGVIDVSPATPPPNSSNPRHLASTTRGALFTASDAEGLWVYHTDGTPDGTVRLPLSGPRQRVTGVQRIGDAVFIAVQSETYDNGAIFVTDGTVAGTRVVWNASQRGTIHVHAVQVTGLSEVNGSLYFAGYTHATGMELMRLDDTGGITGYAYDDANGNGVRDLSELPLIGWRVFLDRNGDGMFNRGEKSTFPDEIGAYGFPALSAGEYTVRVVPGEAGWTSAAVAAPVQRGRTTWRDVSAARATPVYGSVFGNVFKDPDFNGAFDTDKGDRSMGGVRVYLDLNRNGYYTRGEPQAFTDASGNYRFEQVLPGYYRLAVVDLGPGHEYTRGMERMLLVRANRSHDVDFGIGYDGNGMIHGVVFHDRDGDGKQDSNEPGLAGVTVHLGLDIYESFDSKGMTTLTDSMGYYQFSGLRRGTHGVSVMSLWGDWYSAPFNGIRTLEPSGTALVSSGWQQRGTASISGKVFSDENGDGAWQTGVEPGAGGWWIYADVDRDGKHDSDEPGTWSNTSTGAYTLNNLLSGAYLVRFIPPDDTWTFTHGAESVEVNVVPWQRRRLNAGATRPRSITGTIFYDRDGDRILTGDPGKSGVTVYLDLNHNGLHDPTVDTTTVTDSQGRYRFDNTPVGTFYVVPIAPTGWTITSGIYNGATAGGGTTEFRPMSVSDRLTLRAQLFHDRDGDGAYSRTESLSGYTVFVDFDKDGQLDASEPQVQTNKWGTLILRGLPLGEHVVRFIPRLDDTGNSVVAGAITVTLPHPSVRPGRVVLVPFAAVSN
ncbi:MAG TPA: SdrD B-like domain-containing protein [Tepidisphaeraceae bacterium]|nr:SdrD B-like domain-containing protein [Tepidisphaeraceae bacterium]